MAARRIFSLLAAKFPQNHVKKELPFDFHPSLNSVYRHYDKHSRRFQTLGEATNAAVENPKDHETCSSKHDSDPNECISNSIDNETTANHRVNSKLKISERHDLAMIYTCKVCDTRSFKTVCCESYDKGVVVVRCDGCNNLHLIADRLGWFGEPGSVEEFLAASGEEVKKGSMETLNLTLEDLVGRKNIYG